MLKVLPIQSKEIQKERAEACGVPFRSEDLAYGAEQDGVFCGICQFRFLKDRGYIDNLAPLLGVDDFTMMFIMGRAAMNFIDLAGMHACEAAPDSAPESLLLAIGFVKQEDGTFYADMTHMFDTPCKHCGGGQ